MQSGISLCPIIIAKIPIALAKSIYFKRSALYSILFPPPLSTVIFTTFSVERLLLPHLKI